MHPLRRLRLAVSLSWTALLVAGVYFLSVARLEAGGKLQQLDVVITTNLKTTKEHVRDYLAVLRSEVDEIFSTLNPLHYEEEEEKPKNGAARYRLVVQHKGTVTLGDSLTVQSGFPKTDIRTFVNGKRVTLVVGKDFSFYQSTWYLTAQHKGNLTFKFLRWDKEEYKTLADWTIAAPDNGETRLYGSSLPVADLVQDGKKMKIDLKPKCPKTLAEAKQTALKLMYPGPFRSALGNRMVQGKLLKAAANEAGEVSFEVQVENKSPWPVKLVRVDAFAKGAVLEGEIEFATAIPPGKSAKGRAVSQPSEPEGKRVPGVRVTSIHFEVKE